jgi:hypothetical protein
MKRGEVFSLATRKRVPETPALPEVFDDYLDTEKLIDMLDALTAFRQAGDLTQRNIDARRVLLTDTPDNGLFTWINQSTQQDWALHPAFYAAVYEEIAGRNLLKR